MIIMHPLYTPIASRHFKSWGDSGASRRLHAALARGDAATARPWWNVRFGPTELCFQATGGALQPEAPADAKKMCFPKMWRHCASVLMRGSGIMSINFIQFHRRFWSILSSGGHVNLHGKAHIWISHDSHDMFLLLAACWLGLGSSSAF